MNNTYMKITLVKQWHIVWHISCSFPINSVFEDVTINSDM